MKIKLRTEEELKQLARDTLANKIFWSTSLKQHELHMLRSVFIPLGFLKKKVLEDFKKRKVVAFYEYYGDKTQTGRAINGLPMFVSCHAITASEYDRFVELYNAAKDALENALGAKKPKENPDAKKVRAKKAHKAPVRPARSARKGKARNHRSVR